MNEESARIDRALDALIADDAEVVAPPRLAAAVMREWDRCEAEAARRRRAGLWREARIWTLAAGAAAAMFIAAALLRTPVPTQVETTPAVSSSAALTGEPAGPTGAAPPVPEPRVSLNDNGVEMPRTGPAAPARGAPATDAGWVIVPPPLVDSVALHVVRVRMSRTALATLGVPIGNPEADGLVDVEMLVGDDGVAQSIRRASFVPAQVETGGEQ